MMKLDKNILFTAGAGVFGVIALVVAFLLFQGISNFSAEEKGLQGAFMRLRKFYQMNPFPSVENIEREKNNQRQLDDWYVKIIDGLQQGQVPLKPEHRSPSVFNDVYGKVRAELGGKIAVKEGFVVDGFAFGFDEYADGTPPAPDDVPVLTQQLTMIKDICHILRNANVKEISSITRDKLKPDVVRARRPATRGRGLSRPRSSGRKTSSRAVAAVATSSPVIASSKLYSKQHFTFEFKVKEFALFNVLNELADDAMFCVVTSLEINKICNDIRPPRVKVSLIEGENDETRCEADDDTDSINRIVCGVNLEDVMDVKLSLIVYNFQGN